MIQRVQSIWLFLATIILILMMFLPLVSKETGGSEVQIYTNGLHQKSIRQGGTGVSVDVFLPLMITNIAVATICLFNIFNFRRRSFQKRIAIVNIALICGFAFWCSIYAKKLPGGLEGASFGLAAYLPAVAILFIVLAIFGINNDERLIRSAERLR